MPRGTTVEFELDGPTYGTALIAEDDSIWIAVQPKWWDLASWLWWWLCPSERKATITLTVGNGIGGTVRVRSRSIRVARKYVRIRGIPRGL